MGNNEIPEMMESAAKTASYTGIFNIVVTVLCIWAAWWALQNFRFDLFVRSVKSPQSRLLMIFVSIVIGYTVARFIIDYLSWSLMLKWMF